MFTPKIKPLNEDPNKVLELLNENKRNLPYLVMQHNNIIELYLQLLGKNLKKSNCNEVILPEIISLLKTLDYHCEFTKSGIYSDGQAILTLSENGISIINGKNITTLEEVMLTSFPVNSMSYVKNIVDLSKIDYEEDFFELLSPSAKLQIQNPDIPKTLNLEKIQIHTTINERN